MNRTRALKYEAIAEQIQKDLDIVSVISCNTCVRLAKTGGTDKMKQLALRLKSDGYNVRDGFLITLPCWDYNLKNISIHPSVTSVIVLGCSCACANIANHFPTVRIIPAVIDRGTVVEDPITHKKTFRGTKR